MEAVKVAEAIAAQRAAYAPHWDANLFRALDDVAKRLSRELLPVTERYSFLKIAGVKDIQS